VNAIEIMTVLRDLGWLVTLKAAPDDIAYLIDQATSEYDAPREPTYAGKGQWMCEAAWMGTDYRPGEFCFGVSADDAAQKMWAMIRKNCGNCGGEGVIDSGAQDQAGNWINVPCPWCNSTKGR
jgi:hypothetical protein